MSSKLKVLQVIPKLGYGGAETGCYDLGHYLHEKNAKSYIVTSGGKRLRPLIVLLAAKALGYSGKEQINAAAIIEFIHTATLLHDDVVDSSDRRRGRDTANTVFGNQASVLVGDFLYSRAFQILPLVRDTPYAHVRVPPRRLLRDERSAG